MVLVIGVDPAFKAVNDGIFPVPEAAKPIEGVEFVQLNVPPAGILAKLLAVVEVPAQTV